MGAAPNGHNSPLHKGTKFTHRSWDESIDAHVKGGVPKERMVMGVPFYGKAEKNPSEANKVFVDKNGKMIPEVAQGNYIVKLTKGGGGGTPVGDNDGSLAKPFTPAEANAFAAQLAADQKTDKEYYIKGKIIEITEKNQFNTQYGNCTFYISDDGTDKNDKFYIFRTLYLGNVKYTDDSWAKPKAGDEVIIYGKVVNYKGNTPETVQNQSYIYSLNGNTSSSKRRK
jgi:hypothetical protein